MRYLTDTQGREWRVYERPGSGDAHSPGRPSLIFDSEGIVRRLWRYPAEWTSLGDGQLLALMDNVRAPTMRC